MPYVYGRIDLQTLKPHRKNPTIANVFSQMGIVEELGSGTKKMFKYTPLFSGGKEPLIEEQDVYRIIIPLEENPQRQNGESFEGLFEGINEGIKQKLILVLDYINIHPYSRTQMIAEGTQLPVKSLERYLKMLKSDYNLIAYYGSKKSGGYALIQEAE